MSTAIKNLEKELLFKWLYNEKISLLYFFKGEEYHFTIERITKHILSMKTDRPLFEPKIGADMELFFDFKDTRISFHVSMYTTDNRDGLFEVTIPEILYTDLGRSFFRVPFPENLLLEFSFDDRYQLPYPRISTLEDVPQQAELKPDGDIPDFSDIITHINLLAQEYADGIKVVLFKGTEQLTLEEQLITQTGKTLFLPSTRDSFIEEDPFPEKKIITKALFKSYLKSTGENPILLDKAVDRFLQSLYIGGILSASWIPIIFQEYIIGYIYIWIHAKQKPPLEYVLIEQIQGLTGTLVASMKLNGYFESYRIEGVFKPARGIDISPSGLSFSFLPERGMPVLLPKSRLLIKLIFLNYTAEIPAQIIRWKEEPPSMTMVCHFLELQDKDMHYLFKFFYGKDLGDPGSALFIGTT